VATADDLKTRNPELQHVLCIEGYEYLLTDGQPSDAVTAWAATQWSKALPGLAISGTLTQSIAPLKDELGTQKIRFTITPDSSDQFGKDAFMSTPTADTSLTVAFDSTDSAGGFNINVLDITGFSAGQAVFVGQEAFTIGTPTGTTLPVASGSSGLFAPFGQSTSANVYNSSHNIPPASDIFEKTAGKPPSVSTSPKSWIGRRVGLWVHTVRNGVLDVKADAMVLFAGTISEVSEDGLATVLDCDDILRAVEDAVILDDTWAGEIGKDIIVSDGEKFRFGIRINSSPFTLNYSNTITAATPGTGTSEIPSGSYTLEALLSLLDTAANADALIGSAGSAVTADWRLSLAATGRVRLTCERSSSWDGVVSMHISSYATATALGISPPFEGSFDDEPITFFEMSTMFPPDDTQYIKIGDFGAAPAGVTVISEDMTIDFSDTAGTFYDYTSDLPLEAKDAVGAGETWSYYTFGESLFFARRVSETQIDKVKRSKQTEALELAGAGSAPIKQALFVSMRFKQLVATLFASIDGNGTNEATYDAMPWGAGIPWELLGQSFLDSLDAVASNSGDGIISMLVTKPTRVWDAVKSDFLLRLAKPVFRDGTIIVADLGTPNASESVYALDESNKGGTDRTTTRVDRSALTHTLKIEYNRNPNDDKYADKYIARDKVAYESASSSGGTKTIKARNSYSLDRRSGASIEDLADYVTARMLPVLSRPLKYWRRSITHQQFHLAPGDMVTVTDDFARDPVTGARGVSARPAQIVALSRKFGISGDTYFGEVDLLYTEEDKLLPLAPSMLHASISSGSYVSGYASPSKKILVERHKYSAATASADSSHFSVGDKVRIVEFDHDSSVDSFTDEIVSITENAITGYDSIELLAGFTTPAFVSTNLYSILFDTYSVVASGQKDVAYQADKTTGKIGLDQPVTLGQSAKQLASAFDGTELPDLLDNASYGPQAPLSTAQVRSMAVMGNNLLAYKCKPSAHLLVHWSIANAAGAKPLVAYSFPFWYGEEQALGGVTLSIACQFRSDLAGGGKVRIFCTGSPMTSGTFTDYDVPTTVPSNALYFDDAGATFTTKTAQTCIPEASNFLPGATWITVVVLEKTTLVGLPEIRVV